MAGIGFELRSFLKHGYLVSVLQAYAAAGIISAGPWIVSILGIFMIGLMMANPGFSSTFIGEFQVSVTYLMATSLILTGPMQFLFTRFISDRYYEKQSEAILPNFLGAITLTTLVSGIIATIILSVFFDGSWVYRGLMLASFVVVCNIWIVVVLLSASKAWKTIVLAFFAAYVITVGTAAVLKGEGLEGLLFAFFLGQGILFLILFGLVLRDNPSRYLVAFDFLRPSRIYPSLALTGLFYNVAIWADKFIFWYNPLTSESVLQPLRASPLYDLPIFLAYLSIVPGMAVFLVRVETDFAESHERFYRAIREGGTLREIQSIKADLVNTVRKGLYEIIVVQGLTVVILISVGGHLLEWFGIPSLYRLLFNVDLIAVGVQMLFMATLNVLFYFDERRTALMLTALFAASNIIFTFITQALGPAFFGYGFAGASILSSIVGLVVLTQKLDRLEFITYMRKTVLF